MSKQFLKPKAGVLVRNADKPRAPHIKPDGEWLIPTQYILRRMRDGDLIEAKPPEAVKAKPPTSTKPKTEKGD